MRTSSNNLGNDVAQIDLATRTLAGSPIPVGFFPLAAALGPAGLLVANEGMMRAAKLPAPVTAPPFAPPPPDLERSSSLSVVPTYADGSLATGARRLRARSVDPAPDGVRQIGGAHPAAVVALRRRPYAFVAMSNVDRVATVSLSGTAPHAAGGTELRLYDRGPYGTQPDALALSRDEKRLYVALAGIDAVAVLDVTDPVRPHRIGLIPTGWYPTALALSPDGRYLYVCNAKGSGTDRGFTGDQAASSTRAAMSKRCPRTATPSGRRSSASICGRRTYAARRRSRFVSAHDSPRQNGSRRAAAIRNRRQRGHQTRGRDPAREQDLRRDARRSQGRFGRAVRSGDPNSSHSMSRSRRIYTRSRARTRSQAMCTPMRRSRMPATSSRPPALRAPTRRRRCSSKTVAVRSRTKTKIPKITRAQDTSSIRWPFADFRTGITATSCASPATTKALPPIRRRTIRPSRALRDAAAPTQGLGGLYALDVPALAALGGHVDLAYPGWNLRIRDVRRAEEFVRDFDPLAKADRMPAFTYVWLPNDHGGFGRDIPALPEEVADGDRALGRIVDYLTHLPQWSSTAIFIMPDDAQSTRDHIDEHRTYAVVVSPYAKRHVVGTRHLSTVSALKTEEELLGLPALSLGDALATDMSDLFTTTPDVTPYEHVDAPTQTAAGKASGSRRCSRGRINRARCRRRAAAASRISRAARTRSRSNDTR